MLMLLTLFAQSLNVQIIKTQAVITVSTVVRNKNHEIILRLKPPFGGLWLVRSFSINYEINWTMLLPAFAISRRMRD